MPKGGGSKGGAASPMRSSPPRTTASQPPAPIKQSTPEAQDPQQTATGQPTQGAGVAAGSAMGHVITAGGGVQSQPDVTYCQLEMKQFVECVDRTRDISLCQEFKQALIDCNIQYIKSRTNLPSS